MPARDVGMVRQKEYETGRFPTGICFLRICFRRWQQPRRSRDHGVSRTQSGWYDALKVHRRDSPGRQKEYEIADTRSDRI